MVMVARGECVAVEGAHERPPGRGVFRRCGKLQQEVGVHIRQALLVIDDVLLVGKRAQTGGAVRTRPPLC